jgi:hypothetical protein
MADGRVATSVIHVVARIGARPRGLARPVRDHEVGFAETGGFAAGREWSAIRNVARETVTLFLQRGHVGFMLLPLTPSRYESDA